MWESQHVWRRKQTFVSRKLWHLRIFFLIISSANEEEIVKWISLWIYDFCDCLFVILFNSVSTQWGKCDLSNFRNSFGRDEAYDKIRKKNQIRIPISVDPFNPQGCFIFSHPQILSTTLASFLVTLNYSKRTLRGRRQTNNWNWNGNENKFRNFSAMWLESRGRLDNDIKLDFLKKISICNIFFKVKRWFNQKTQTFDFNIVLISNIAILQIFQ